MASSLRVFAYGSNLFVPRMSGRVPSARVFGRARLADHALRFHKRGQDGSAKANVVPSPDACVWGVVYELEHAHIDLLDRCEGGYARREMMVEVHGAGRLAAHVYVAKARLIDDTLKPHAWYKRLVVDGARMHDLPAEYVSTLHAVATIDEDG